MISEKCCNSGRMRNVIHPELTLFLILSVVVLGVSGFSYASGINNEDRPMTLKLSSPVFSANDSIPKVYTCDSSDISPPLAWSGLPPGTMSLVLIVDDPDAPDPKAPKMTWVHWVLYNIPADAKGLEEDAGRKGLPAGTRNGANDWKRTGYGGPCPPKGRHRYFFKLYALDTVLPELNSPTKKKLLKAMQGHILDKAELIGTYKHGWLW